MTAPTTQQPDILSQEVLLRTIRRLVDQYIWYQDERIALDGRLGITKKGAPKKGAKPLEDSYIAELLLRKEEVMGMENLILEGTPRKFVRDDQGKIIERIPGERHHCINYFVHQHPMWEYFFKGVNGCGEIGAAVLLTTIDIHKADTVSKMWSYAGLSPHMTYGKIFKGDKIVVTTTKIRADIRTPGFLCPYNGWLRMRVLGVLAPCLIKRLDKYYLIYTGYRNRLEQLNWGEDSKNPTDKSKPKANHQHRAAIRYMIKIFFIDLYKAWRTFEGLPVREPYQEQYLGHKHHAN